MPGGASFLITRSATETGGESVEMEITLPPGAPGSPLHVHPNQEERWDVLEGELTVFLDDRWRPLRAGESLSIPAGHTHTLRNRSSERVRVRDSHWPALDFEDYIVRLHSLAEAGKIRDPRSPSTLIHFSMLWQEQRSQVAARPLERRAMSLLARLGRLLRFRA
jgi:mannose-6-phosphate isomerase-like protein (cupin superfamily)